MIAADDPKFLKLPKWAQDEIRTQQAAFENLYQRFTAAVGASNKPTRVVINPSNSGDRAIKLDSNTRVTFRTDEGEITAHLVSTFVDGAMQTVLNISGYATGIMVLPMASNVVFVKCQK